MTEDNSPYFRAGVEDGQADAAAVASCPPQAPRGPDLERMWSVMYQRGYSSVPRSPHVCDRTCRGR